MIIKVVGGTERSNLTKFQKAYQYAHKLWGIINNMPEWHPMRKKIESEIDKVTEYMKQYARRVKQSEVGIKPGVENKG